MIKRKLSLDFGEYIEVELIKEEGGLNLSMSGTLKDSWGQNYDELYEQYVVENSEFTKKDKLARLIEIWKQYHLNELTPGTPKQMELLKDKDLGYTEAVDYLKAFDLNIDNGYAYGSAWLRTEIPQDIVDEVVTIVENW